MIFISAEIRRSGVFSRSLVKPTAGDPMTKLIATALLSVGFAAASMAADMPKSAGPIAADQPAANSSTTAPAKSGKKHGKKGGKKSNPAPSSK
jgi:hypothetical protein